MAIDFRANQIRVEKIISSGSSIIIYPSGAAENLIGTINTAVFPQTGFGSDVFLFVSGGVTRGGSSRNVSLFGGILVSSGAVYGLAGFSGSLTKLTDGTSYLVASSGISIVTNSNGSITISTSGSLGNSFSFNSASVAFSGSSGLSGSTALVFDNNLNALKLFEVEEGVEVTKNKIKFIDPTSETGYRSLKIESANAIVSGAGGHIELIAGNSGFLDGIPSSGGSISITAGSGSAVDTTFIQIGGTGGSLTLTPGAGGSSIGTARGGQGGSLLLNGGTGGNSISGIGGNGSNIYITAGTAGSGSTSSGLGGNVEITAGQPYFGFASADSGYVKINVSSYTLSRALSSASIRIDSDGFARNIIFGFDHVSVGGITDSYFIVSGSPSRNALFISDVVSSGSIKAIAGFSGSLTNLTDGSSYLIATGGISIATQSNGSVVISSSIGGSSLPAGTNGGVLAYSGSNWVSTNSGSIYTPLVASGSGLPFYSSRVVPLQIGTSVALDADISIGIGNSYKAITFRNFFDTTWIDVWRVDGSNYWTYGTSNTTDCSGTNILVPSNGQFNLNRGGYVHLGIDGSGNTTFGSTVYQSTILGSSLIIGQTSVVSEYRGGAKVPETTISSDTTLGNSNEVVFVDTIASVVTASLPAGTSGRIISIQRITGSNDLVIVRAGSDTIRAGGSSGLTEWKISDNGRHGLIFRNSATEWVAES